ncbi:MAG: family NAD(P)-dependent oxidoreductase [Marmoricola sp.]|nr:family NAD(P)-dependent oxidoreductase [Marmoricola sp.]
MSSAPKKIVLTGASDGLGAESASQLAAQGHDLVLSGRNPEKLAGVVARIRAESPSVEVTSFACDFADLDAVRRLAGEVLDACPRIDVLLNNAGTIFMKRSTTAQGYESTFAVNHLAPFLLTELLLERVTSSGPGRIVNTASTMHYRGKLDFSDLGYDNGYSGMKAYGRSKLATVAASRELATRLEGTGVTVNSLHPGAVATSIYAVGPAPVAGVVKGLAGLVMMSAAQGGATLTRLATGDDVAGLTGGYYEKTKLKQPAKPAQDPAFVAELDRVSREMVGL